MFTCRYTFCLADSDKAEKLRQSLPPSTHRVPGYSTSLPRADRVLPWRSPQGQRRRRRRQVEEVESFPPIGSFATLRSLATTVIDY